MVEWFKTTQRKLNFYNGKNRAKGRQQFRTKWYNFVHFYSVGKLNFFFLTSDVLQSWYYCWLAPFCSQRLTQNTHNIFIMRLVQPHSHTSTRKHPRAFTNTHKHPNAPTNTHTHSQTPTRTHTHFHSRSALPFFSQFRKNRTGWIAKANKPGLFLWSLWPCCSIWANLCFIFSCQGVSSHLSVDLWSLTGFSFA